MRPLSDARYVGADVVPDMISANRREFAAFQNMEFREHDLVKDAIPVAPHSSLQRYPCNHTGVPRS